MKGDPIDIAAAQVVLDLCSYEGLVDSALSAIEVGYDVPSLYVLAALSGKETVDSKEVFLRVMRELGMSLPSKHAAVLTLSQALARDILSGTITPEIGARKIWDLTLRAPTEQISGLDTFVYAASEWDERPEDCAMFEKGVRDAAAKLVNGGGRADSDDLPRRH